GQADSVRYIGRIEAPGSADVFKRKIPAVAESKVWAVEAAKKFARLDEFRQRQPVGTLELIDVPSRIGVHQVALLPGANEQVLEAIEIDIEKDGTPRPITGGHTAELRDLGIRAVTAIQVEHIVLVTGPVINSVKIPRLA